LGQHSYTSDVSRFQATGKRRWATLAAGAAVAVAASTTAWAAFANGDTPSGTSGLSGISQKVGPTAFQQAAPAALFPATATPFAGSATSGKSPVAVPAVAKHTAQRQPHALKKCVASHYSDAQMTASGESFDPSALTVASPSLPFGTRVQVINPKTGASVTARVNDRGPYVEGRCLDLSRAAFDRIGDPGIDVMPVEYRVLGD